MKPDLSTWLTSDEASEQLGVKYRTLLDMVRRRLLRPRKVLRSGVPGGRVSMYDPKEVESLAEKRAMSRTEIVLARETGVRGADIVGRVFDRQPAEIPVNGSLTAALAGREQFLTIEDAAVYIGLPYAELHRLVTSGELPARKAGRWYIRRRDLDKL